MTIVARSRNPIGGSEFGRVIGACFGEHPQRTLTKLGRVRVSHSSILQKDQTERNPGRFRVLRDSLQSEDSY